jgi:hypothetical protein
MWVNGGNGLVDVLKVDDDLGYELTRNVHILSISLQSLEVRAISHLRLCNTRMFGFEIASAKIQS